MSRGDDVIGAEVYRFGELEVDEGLRQVRRCGAIVAVEPKPFELLVFLIRHRNRVVLREELMQALWPGIVVSEATLSSAVRRAREAIAPERELIEGVRKVGYRFAGRLESELPQAPALPATSAATSAAAAAQAAAATPTAPAYVGRRRELDEIGAALEQSLSGGGTVVAVTGEPGIGKTRTIEEIVARLGSRAEVLVGRCYEGDGVQAFWPWVQVFRSFAAHRSESALNDVLGAEAGDIARLTAAVAAPPETSPLTDPEMLRARLLDAVVVVLVRAARRSPLVVVLDDLHWADRASLTLLLAVSRQIAAVPLAIVGAYRELEVSADHPLASAAASLKREGLMRSVRLGGLDRSESLALLHASAGAPVPPAAASAVFEATEGNPFFALEYWRDLEEGGAVVRGEQGWVTSRQGSLPRVPASVAEIIDRRLRRLSPACVRLLTIGAVMGRELDHDVLGVVSETPEDEVIDLLDQATAARVLEEVAGHAGRYRFAHALIRQTLYESMTELRRAALHRYVGEAIERRESAGAGTRAGIATLAHHFLAAGPAGGARKAIAYAERAAAEATQACAYDAAVEYLGKAADLADGLARNDAPDSMLQQAEVHEQLAEALGRAGDGERMRESFARAAELARSASATAVLARAAIGLSRNAMVVDKAAVELCEEALAALPATEIAVRSQVQASLARCLYPFDGTRQRRVRLCEQARLDAARTGDEHVVGEVLADCLEAQFDSDALAQRDELTAALSGVAEASGDIRLRLLGRAWQIVNLMCHGRLNEADERLRPFAQMAGELRQRRFLHHAAVFRAGLLLARGHLEEAEECAAEALRLGLSIDEGAARWLHWGQLHHIRREQGRFPEFLGEGLALRLPPGTSAAHAFQRTYRWAAPHVFSELGRAEEAKASFDELMQEGLEGLPPDNGRNTRIPVLQSLADVSATIGDAHAAARLHPVLSQYADQWFVLGWGSVIFASSHNMLGALCGVQQRWEEATAHFEEAMRQHDAQHAACAQARTLYQWARMLLRRGRGGDAQQARGFIDRGLGICAVFGLKGAEDRLRRLGVGEVQDAAMQS